MKPTWLPPPTIQKDMNEGDEMTSKARRDRLRGVLLAAVCALAMLAIGAGTASAAESLYGAANIGSGANFDSQYTGWVGYNRVFGNNRVCAGQSTYNHNFYGSYACVSSGSAYKYYPDLGNRRARAHNGSSYQYVAGYIGY